MFEDDNYLDIIVRLTTALAGRQRGGRESCFNLVLLTLAGLDIYKYLDVAAIKTSES